MRQINAGAVIAVLAAVAFAAGSQAATLLPAVRGQALVLLYSADGEFDLHLYKRDLNIYPGTDRVTGVVYGPGRTEAGRIVIPDDGSADRSGRAEDRQKGKAEISTGKAGLYRLFVTARGGDFVFGLRPSCDHYMVEGPVKLSDHSVSGQVCFVPPRGKFEITAEPLHKSGTQKATLFDAEGNKLRTLALQKGEEPVNATLNNSGDAEEYWCLQLPKMDAEVQVEGVGYWATEGSAVFAADELHNMIQPAHIVRYVQPGQQCRVEPVVHNHSDRSREFEVEIQADEGLQCRPVDEAKSREIGAGRSSTVPVEIRVAEDVGDGERLTADLRVTAAAKADFVQTATIEMRIAFSPVSKPLDLPIELKRYHHERVQFGYEPEYICNEVYFDHGNRPFIRDRTVDIDYTGALTYLDDGKWVGDGFLEALRNKYSEGVRTDRGGGFLGAKVAFDADNGAYTLVRVEVRQADGGRRWQSVLIYRPAGGKNYQLYEVPGRSFDIEQFTGHNEPQTPPILAYRRTGPHSGRWARVHDLLFIRGTREGGQLQLQEPILVSDRCIGSCQHSGGPGSLVTIDGRTHIVWGEVTSNKVPGVPTYIATYNHDTGQIGPKTFLGYAPPINDVHNVPAICADSGGYLHVVLGAHGEAFQYTHSLAPNLSGWGWTKPVKVGESGYVTDNSDGDGMGRQTYISLVCDDEDTLHIAFRQWRRNDDDGRFPDRRYAALSVQKKPKEKQWSGSRPLVTAPVAGYSIWYHKLTIDRVGRLFLSYNHWTSDSTYQRDFPGRYNHRAVLMSSDRGETWKLAETEDFAEGLRQRASRQ